MLLTIAVLARLLDPRDFGLVAIATVVASLLVALTDLGVNQAVLVLRDDEVEEYAETAFVAGIGIGMALWAMCAAAGPVAAAVFDEPEVTAIFVALGATFLLRSLGATHATIAQKQLDFRKRTIAELADVLVKGAVGIGLALAGAGAWSIVGGQLAGTAALSLTAWLTVPWRPRFKPRREHLRHLLRFGGALTAVSIVAALIGSIDSLLVGAVLTTTDLGIYTIAFRIPELGIAAMSSIAARVLFPALALVPIHERAGPYLKTLQYTVLVCLPLAVGFAILAEPLIQVAFGDRWRDATVPMRLLSVYAFALAVTVPAQSLFKASGKAATILRFSVPWLISVCVSVTLVARFGLAAVAGAQAVCATAAALGATVMAARSLGLTASEIVRAVGALVLAGALLALALGATTWLVDGALLQLGVASLVGAAVYVASLRLLAPSEFQNLKAHLRRTPPKDPPTSDWVIREAPPEVTDRDEVGR